LESVKASVSLGRVLRDPEQQQQQQQAPPLFRDLAPVGAHSRQSLDLSHYQRLGLQEMPRVSAEGVSTLILREARLDAEQWARLSASVLAPAPAAALRHLDIRGNKLGNNSSSKTQNPEKKKDGCAALSSVLEHCTGLAELIARGNNLRDPGCGSVLSALKTAGATKCLVKLDFADNSAMMVDDTLLSMIQKLTCLRVLDLSWNVITLPEHTKKMRQDVSKFQTALGSLRSLEVLGLAHNRLLDRGCSRVLSACAGLKGLRLLDLSFCGLSDAGEAQLTVALGGRPASAPKAVTAARDRRKSTTSVETITAPPALGVLVAIGSTFSPATAERLRVHAATGDRRLVLSGHHQGIEFTSHLFVPADARGGLGRDDLPVPYTPLPSTSSPPPRSTAGGLDWDTASLNAYVTERNSKHFEQLEAEERSTTSNESSVYTEISSPSQKSPQMNPAMKRFHAEVANRFIESTTIAVEGGEDEQS
jgi:hypothetical protein